MSAMFVSLTYKKIMFAFWFSQKRIFYLVIRQLTCLETPEAPIRRQLFLLLPPPLCQVRRSGGAPSLRLLPLPCLPREPRQLSSLARKRTFCKIYFYLSYIDPKNGQIVIERKATSRLHRKAKSSRIKTHVDDRGPTSTLLVFAIGLSPELVFRGHL
jgi:hypothetical protein